MTVVITEQDFYDMRKQRDDERTKNSQLQIALATLTAHLENANIATTSLQIQNIKLIRGSEAMQADAVNNTTTINMLMAQNNKLNKALTDIRATTVTLGESQSAWIAWRKCSEIAGKALEKK